MGLKRHWPSRDSTLNLSNDACTTSLFITCLYIEDTSLQPSSLMNDIFDTKKRHGLNQ